MKSKELKTKKCKRIVYKRDGYHRESVILGYIIQEDNRFLTFKTGRKTHILAKDTIASIEETDIDFKEDNSNDL